MYVCPVVFGPFSGFPANAERDKTWIFLVVWGIYFTEEYILNYQMAFFFCFLGDAFLSSLPSDLLRWSFSSSCFCPALWKPSLKLQGEQGMGQHERRHEIWPAAPVAKKTAVAEPLGKHSSRSTMLWAAREGPRLTVSSLGRGFVWRLTWGGDMGH